jgi:hypothetical protein
MVASLTPVVRARAESVANLLGVAGKIMDDAVAARRAELETARRGASDDLQKQADQSVAAAANAAQTRAAQAQSSADAVAKAAATNAENAREPPKLTLQEQVETSIRKIQDKVGEAIARYEAMLRGREAALNAAEEQQAGGYRRAATQDQLDLQSPSDTHDPKQRRILIAQSQKWADDHITDLKSTVDKLKQEAARLVRGGEGAPSGYIPQVETTGIDAYAALRAWAAAQNAETETWWKDLSDRLDQWAKNAHDRTSTWASAEVHAARLNLMENFNWILATSVDKAVKDQRANKTYASELEATRHVISETLTQSSTVDQLALGLREQVVSEQRAAREKEINDELLGLPNDQWDKLAVVARSENPGFDPADRMRRIDEAIHKIRTDKEELFGALNNLRPLELAALKKAYASSHNGRTLDEVLQSDSSLFWQADKEHAAALLQGDQVSADAATLYDAISGLGTKEKPIMEVLRSAKPEDLPKLREAYKKLSGGESLEDALRGDLSGSELNQALSLLNGERAEADADAIDHAMRGSFFGASTGDVSVVYDQVRDEVVARGKREQWTSAQVEAEITRRNAEIEQHFNKQFAGVAEYTSNTPDRGPLRGAFAYGFTVAEKNLATALTDNDLAAADSARVQIERTSVYADDDMINKVLKSQYDRALLAAQLDEGPERQAALEAKIRKEAAAGKFKTPKDQQKRRMELEREMNRDLNTSAAERSKTNMGALRDVFKGTYHQSLGRAIEENMSGESLEEARKRLANNGDLEPLDKLHYSIYGPGTNLPVLRSTLNSLSKSELNELKEK